MNIAVDCDGVLAKFLDGFLSYINKKFKSDLKRKDIFKYEIWASDKFPFKDDENFQKILTDFARDNGFARLEPILDAQICLQDLKNLHNFHIITSRITLKEKPNKVEKQTKNWINKHFPNIFRKIHFTNNLEKYKICLENNYNVLIEDSAPIAIEAAKSGIKTILLDTYWNKEEIYPELKHKNIIRAREWNHIKEILKDS